MSKINYQEAIDAAVMSCCPETEAFGAGEDQAFEAALASAQQSQGGWASFVKAFVQGLADHLISLPNIKVSLDKAALLKLIEDWFEAKIRPMKFSWLFGFEEVGKDLMLSGLLTAASFMLDRFLG